MQPIRQSRHLLVLVLALAMALIAPLGSSAVTPDDDPGSPVLQLHAAVAQESSVDADHAALATSLFESVFNGSVAPGALIAADAVIHTTRGEFTGPDGLQTYLDIMNRRYPNASYDVTSLDVQGDTVVIQWTMNSTRFVNGLNPDRIEVHVSIPGETTITVADGQVAELTQATRDTATQSTSDVVHGRGVGIRDA